ncbi:MAG: ATP-binding protein [Gammaproteobacteria bacterium]|nr:ATP-binding protein [Gammaproteobacteria bacterium]
MQINPGGYLDLDDVVGRDDDIARYWRVLRRQSLVLSAERRIGKTHILLKMQDECLPGYLPFYQDLEGVHTVLDLIRSIYGTVQRSLPALSKIKGNIAKWSALLPNKIAGVNLPTAEQTWQLLLSEAFDDLIGIAGDDQILLLWDEFPLMLHNLHRQQGADMTMELLDHLRALRLVHSDRLRFVLTGSVGLHLVLRNLRRAGHANDPVNDMHSVTVPPITQSHARDLAASLLKTTQASPGQIADLASLIADEIGGFPYYVHHIVDQLDQLPRPPGPADVSNAVEQVIYNPHDPANLRYYANRLLLYYDERERTLALVVLRALAGQPEPTSAAKLLNLCRHEDVDLSAEKLREVLTLLEEDHYIEARKSPTGAAYDFRWPLVRKWWRETQL